MVPESARWVVALSTKTIAVKTLRNFDLVLYVEPEPVKVQHREALGSELPVTKPAGMDSHLGESHRGLLIQPHWL